MSSTTVQRQEERWTPTTIETTFVLPSLRTSRPRSSSGCTSINFPFLNLGWTFALSLKLHVKKWTPAVFSFRQHDRAIPWGNTSMHAQLSLVVEQPACDPPSSTGAEERTPPEDMASNSMSLGAMNVVLANTPSLEHPITTSCTISLFRPNKIRLIVTLSDCPLANGLFQACSDSFNEAKVQAQLVRLGNDRLLGRSLATGKLFNVKFLTYPTRSTSGSTRGPLLTYASLPVLEEYLNLSSSILREDWSNALAAHDNANTKRVGEISCPKDYEYELDSDFEDEDEVSFPPCQGDPATLEGQQSECSTESSSSSLSSFELEGASDQGSVDYQPQKIMKGLEKPPSDHKRTIRVKFAAHRTWYAFVWYCYTGDLEFGKLRSQVETGRRHFHVTPLEGGPPTCSPKSMYRLADLVGNKDLKAKALAAIEQRMTEANVVDETFSAFTSKYPEVQEVQLGVLKRLRGSPQVKDAFLRTMKKYGSTPHAEPVLSAFYDKLVDVKPRLSFVS